jgi:hypothetical protein
MNYNSNSKSETVVCKYTKELSNEMNFFPK